MKQEILLEKLSSTGTPICWSASVEENEVTVRWGQIGGKIQEETTVFFDGKDIGRSNETTPAEQCLFETVRKARKKIESGYEVLAGETLVQENTSGTVVTSNLEVPKCTLANDGSKPNHIKKIENQRVFFVQPKLDGNRALVNLKTGKIYSRARKEIGSLPHLGKEVQKIFKRFKKITEWMDGELYSHDLTFNEIQSIIRKKGEKLTEEDIENAKSIGITIFDFVSDLTQAERYTYLFDDDMQEYGFGNSSNKYIQIIDTDIIAPFELREYSERYVVLGYEGAIVRFFDDGGYQQKRSNYLFKYKDFIDAEFKVIGMTTEKNDDTKLATLICEMNDGKDFKARPACTDEEKQEMFDNIDNYIGRMATVKFQHYDAKTGKPIFGVIKGFRAESDLE